MGGSGRISDFSYGGGLAQRKGVVEGLASGVTTPLKEVQEELHLF